MQIRVLSRADVRASVDMPAAIRSTRAAFEALSAGRAQAPLRHHLEAKGATHLFMPAVVEGEDLGLKVVSVQPGNPDRGLPAIHAVVLLTDAATGRPLALMDGTWLTALRTGAAGGVAADLLARPDARVATVFGAGVQARTQLEALRCVRQIGRVRILSRTAASARAFADELDGVDVELPGDPDDAVAGADVVVTATSSATPLFRGGSVGPGTHVTAVGAYTPEMREVDSALIRAATVFVDQREAVLAEAGDLAIPIEEGVVAPGVIAAEIGEVAAGRHPGRTDPDQITFFKSVGNAVQDVAVAARVLEAAEAAGRGTVLEL